MSLNEDVCTAGPGFAPATTTWDAISSERPLVRTTRARQEEEPGDEMASLSLRSAFTVSYPAMTHTGWVHKSPSFGLYWLRGTAIDVPWDVLRGGALETGSSLPIPIPEAGSTSFTLRPEVQPGSLRELLTTDPLSILPSPHAGAELDSLLRFLRENQPNLYEELLQTAVTGREKEVAETLEFLGAVSFPEGMTHEDIAESDWEAADLQDSPMSEGTS
jgi:hypothetical protein